MEPPLILVATWRRGLFSLRGDQMAHELADQSIRGLVADGAGGMLAIIGGHSLARCSPGGVWTEVIRSEAPLSACVPAGPFIFVGTDDARILRVEADGTHHWLTGFEAVAGRETWYAGSAIIDGKRVGPPLGIRSMAATRDDAVVLANVHVGGIPRSTDLGRTWQPTIAIDADVHQVCAHPTRGDLVIAAAGAGLGISRDAGATWVIEQEGLHALHCSAVAFGRRDLFVSAATDPFAAEGAVYRRPIEASGPLLPVGGGLPRWLEGTVDTHCLATRDSVVALVDGSGRLHLSPDDGETWSSPAAGLAGASGLLVC